MPRKHTPISAAVIDAVEILGAQIAQGRRGRRWTAKELAGRAGITVDTLRNIEKGSTSASLGTVLELAYLVGIPLYNTDPTELSDIRRRAVERLALLPQRIRASQSDEVDDDF